MTSTEKLQQGPVMVPDLVTAEERTDHGEFGDSVSDWSQHSLRDISNIFKQWEEDTSQSPVSRARLEQAERLAALSEFSERQQHGAPQCWGKSLTLEPSLNILG